MNIDLKIPGRKYWMITHIIFPLTSLNLTSFITKLVFRIDFADGVGRLPTNGGGASRKKMKMDKNHWLSLNLTINIFVFYEKTSPGSLH